MADWCVRLGEQEWSKYTYARVEGDALRLLGSVRRGAQIGALGLTEAGEYVQVNGNHVVALSQSQLRQAVAKAKAAAPRPFRARERASTPVVVIKRRRMLASV